MNVPRPVLPPIHLSDADNGRSISLSLSAELIVALPENPTTGYRWRVDSPSGPLALVADDFAVDRAAGAGAAGVRTFTFRAAAAGRASLRLSLCREWEHERPPLQRFSASVDIQP